MFQSFTEFLGQAAQTAEPVEQNVSEDGSQDIDWSAALEQSVNAVWNDASDTEGVVEELDEPEDDVDNDAGWDDEDESESDESEEPEELDESDESIDELTVSTGADTVDSDTDDTEGLWDLLLESFGEPVSESIEEKKDDSSPSTDASELERLKQTVDTLVAWQSAVQEYLQTSIEAENIRTVAQQLASLGVILPDEQIQEIARTSQQLGIPPSVLLKAKAYDYTMQAMRQQGQTPFPFMVNAPSAPSTPSPSSLIPNARPFRPEEPRTQRTGFTRFEEFLRQMGMSE